MCAAWPSPTAAEPHHPYRDAAHVCVDPIVHDYLSGPTFNVVRDEASRIWLRHGVALTWNGAAATQCDALVPLVFDEKALNKHDGNADRESLARTVFLGHTQVIYLSVPRAFEMLKTILPAVVGPQWQESQGGTLLGRVVAHELGHVLLTSTAHATTGLMRPIYGRRDVLSDDERMQDLSTAEARRLVMRFSLVLIEPATARAARGTP